MIRRRLSAEQVAQIVLLFPNHPTAYVAKELNLPTSTINNKAYILRLKKSPEYTAKFEAERAEATDKCLTYECLGKEHDAENLRQAIDNFYEYFGTCKTDYSLAENKWSSSYGLTWALLVRWHFEVFDIIEEFSHIVKKFKKFQKKQKNEEAKKSGTTAK